jgi:hypothetical protein
MKIVKTIQFNTKRLYTEHGQRIVASLHEDGVVTFQDIDRCITGEFPLPQYASFNQVEVMHWYDSGQYTGSSRAWSDGMMRDGCNSKYRYR